MILQYNTLHGRIELVSGLCLSSTSMLLDRHRHFTPGHPDHTAVWRTLILYVWSSRLCCADMTIGEVDGWMLRPALREMGGEGAEVVGSAVLTLLDVRVRRTAALHGPAAIQVQRRLASAATVVRLQRVHRHCKWRWERGGTLPSTAATTVRAAQERNLWLAAFARAWLPRRGGRVWEAVGPHAWPGTLGKAGCLVILHWQAGRVFGEDHAVVQRAWLILGGAGERQKLAQSL